MGTGVCACILEFDYGRQIKVASCLVKKIEFRNSLILLKHIPFSVAVQGDIPGNSNDNKPGRPQNEFIQVCAHFVLATFYYQQTRRPQVNYLSNCRTTLKISLIYDSKKLCMKLCCTTQNISYNSCLDYL